MTWFERDDANAVVLEIADDGNRLPTGFDAEAVTSLGFTIVRALTQQLAGHFAIQSGSGTTCRIIIPEWKLSGIAQ